LKKLSSQPWYKWVVAAACFLMILCCLGFCSSTKGLYLSAITKATGLERSLFSISDTFRYVTMMTLNLFFGALTVRFGARKVVAAGFISLILSMYLYSAATTLPMFYLGGALLGVGQCCTSTATVGYVIGLWFKENKGTVMGAVLAANGIGGALAAQIVSPFINADTFGYRTAYHVTIAILVVIGLLVVLLLRDQPRQSGESKVTAATKKAGWEGITLKECLKKPWFYGIMVSVFISGAVLQSATSTYPAHLKDIGLDPAFVTTVVSIYSLLLTATKFSTGFLYDRLGLRLTLTICSISTAAAMVLLALLQAGDNVLSVVYALLFAIGTPLLTVMLPLIAMDMFGSRDNVRILGIVISVNTAGYATGTPLVNLCYDLQGSYQTVLFVMGGLMVATTCISMLAMNAARKYRETTLKQSEELLGGN